MLRFLTFSLLAIKQKSNFFKVAFCQKGSTFGLFSGKPAYLRAPLSIFYGHDRTVKNLKI